MTTSSSDSFSSVAPDEISRFSALAEKWWDPRGPMRPLHAMNPLRISWACRHIPVQGRHSRRVSALDIGCGAGLASEALAKTGHNVTGLDASANGIAAARKHLETYPLPRGAGSLSYREGSAEELAKEGAKFDAVIAFEIIEHVTDPAAFMATLSQLLEPGGTLIVSTMNRTLSSLAVGKIGAEYLLRLLPTGTHTWKKFVTPAELGRYARAAGLTIEAIAGMSPTITGDWKESRNLSINYIAAFRKL